MLGNAERSVKIDFGFGQGRATVQDGRLTYGDQSVPLAGAHAFVTMAERPAVVTTAVETTLLVEGADGSQILAAFDAAGFGDTAGDTNWRAVILGTAVVQINALSGAGPTDVIDVTENGITTFGPLQDRGELAAAKTAHARGE
jgi:hypothetical protein